MWTINRTDTDESEVVSCRNKSSPRESDSAVERPGSSKGLTLIPLLILNEGTVDHSCYIKNVLSVALKYENQVFDDNWTFLHDGANPH